ncbi:MULTISPECIES: hypothetical protein [unclassified Paenibacillus]|uniref:hypothetical protein n=1 Tax=unclassified Paenibacillus TaxID=185978 RepID=UPI0004F7B15B|nr:hypothetical protein [Paenibacillus sp. FSL H7-0737]AIQ24382.1 hypothetical protein H70737_16930 [Paenibacillus sp. FSL H7-0737]
MTTRALDMRISEHMSGLGSAIEYVYVNPILIGDLGIQTSSIVGTPDANKVRIWLSGSVTFYKAFDTPDETSVTVVIERNGNGILGSGTLIYESQVRPGPIESTASTISITAGDFPDIPTVSNGQIRYSLFIYSDLEVGRNGIWMVNAAFNGIAFAG